MRILVYVEGKSDKFALESLFSNLVQEATERGKEVRFLFTGGKRPLMTQVPVKAADTVYNDPGAVVFAVPDLYPRNMGGQHETFEELQTLLQCQFDDRLKGRTEDSRMRERFRIHCFKYDLEVLILAATDQLASRLGVESVKVSWTEPVEDQDQDCPPSSVVTRLFASHGLTYSKNQDAAAIIGGADPDTLAEKCPQRFKPFLEDLKRFCLAAELDTG